jgi:hypothetical protein
VDRRKKPFVIDCGRLVDGVVQDIRRSVPRPVIAARFHRTVIEIGVKAAGLSALAGTRRVVLGGGVFLNRIVRFRGYSAGGNTRPRRRNRSRPGLDRRLQTLMKNPNIEIRNLTYKSEIRISKYETNSKKKNSKWPAGGAAGPKSIGMRSRCYLRSRGERRVVLKIRIF